MSVNVQIINSTDSYILQRFCCRYYNTM